MITGISPNVTILTRQEWTDELNAAFQRGVDRGTYEANAKANEKIRDLEKQLARLQSKLDMMFE